MKRLVMGVAAALACTAAHSQSTTWTFTYTGFYDSNDQVFRPDITLTGEFSGADMDADGLIERSELSGFQVFLDYPMNLLDCSTVYPESYMCSLDRFSFSPQGGLDFMGRHDRGNLETGHSKYLRVDSGTSWVTGYSSGRFGENPGRSTFLWTPQTSFNIVSSVPEPGQAALLALGLGALAFGRMRRRLWRIPARTASPIPAGQA